MKIDIDRLLSDIKEYAEYGKNDQGGVTRPSFSQADHEVRARFIKELEDMDLKVTIDGAANIWGRHKGSGKNKAVLSLDHTLIPFRMEVSMMAR